MPCWSDCYCEYIIWKLSHGTLIANDEVLFLRSIFGGSCRLLLASEQPTHLLLEEHLSQFSCQSSTATTVYESFIRQSLYKMERPFGRKWANSSVEKQRKSLSAIRVRANYKLFFNKRVRHISAIKFAHFKVNKKAIKIFLASSFSFVFHFISPRNYDVGPIASGRAGRLASFVNILLLIINNKIRWQSSQWGH